MATRKLGEELLRQALMLGRVSSLQQQYSSVALKWKCSHLTSSLQRVWRPLTVYQTSSLRYYTQGQALDGQENGPISSQSSAVATRHSATPPTIQKKGPETLFEFTALLRDCSSPTDVLDLVQNHTLSHRGISKSLKRMWNTTKTMTEEQRRFELQLMMEHPAFEGLCRRAMTEAPRMRPEDLAYSLMGTVKLGVSQRSELVQTLLRVVQENLNEFDEKSLSILAGTLMAMESSQNVNSLKDGLRLLLEDGFPSIQNVMALQFLMRLVGRDASPMLRRKLELKALSMAKDFTPPNTQHMVSTLAVMGLCSKPLLDICSRKMAENIHGIPFGRLLAVLKSCRELRYRSNLLLSSIADHMGATCDMWSNKQVLFYLLECQGLGFRPVSLMDRFAERVIQNSSDLTLKDILCVLKMYSTLNHDLDNRRHDFLASVTTALESYLPRMSSADMLRAGLSLCILGHFPPAPLEQLLQKERLEELLVKENEAYRMNEYNLRVMERCLRLDAPPVPVALTDVLGVPKDPAPYEPIKPDVALAVMEVVGDRAVVEEGVLVDNSYFIDFLLTPPAQKTKEAKVLEEGQRMAVICAHPSSICFGSSHPCGNLAMKLRHLKLLGYTPILVPVQTLYAQTIEKRAAMLREMMLPALESARLAVSQRDDSVVV